MQEALKAYSIHRNITFIEDDFYEGFTYEDISVYTQQELFHHPSQIKRYQKTFKQGQILQNILELEPTIWYWPICWNYNAKNKRKDIRLFTCFIQWRR